MSPWYVRLFLPILKKETPLHELAGTDVQCIFVVSYAAKDYYSLVEVTKQILSRAIRIKHELFPKAHLIFASCSHAFLGSGRTELRLKSELCRSAGVDYLDVGFIINSVTELEACRDLLRQKSALAARILIVTCELHSKREYLLAQKIFPDAKVFVTCVSHTFELEPWHPMPSMRTWPRLIVSQICGYAAFQAMSWGLIPLDRLRKIKRAS